MTTDLFSDLQLGGTTIPNRVMVSPMCQYSCEAGDGVATEWHHVHLGSRAVGGAGIVMSEATAVEPRGRISPEDLGLWSEEHAKALSPTTSFIREQDSIPAIQLAHAGRKASKTRPWEGSEPLSPTEGGWETIAPTDEPYPYDGEPPAQRRMTQEDIETVIDAFRDGARLADAAGFEIVELHAAHGYLFHEFLSPVTNTREDDYGGDFEGRIRLLVETVGAVQEVWPADKPIFVRISASDWLDERPSWTVDQSIRLADRLGEAGVDLLDVSSGGIHPDQDLPHSGPNYQLPYAERIRDNRESDIAVGTVGGITTAQQADAIIRNERADVVIIGRKHLRDPYFTLHAAQELDVPERAEPPVQYRRGF